MFCYSLHVVCSRIKEVDGHQGSQIQSSVGPVDAGPGQYRVFNLPFLNAYEAEMAPTEGEHRAWLAAAGFKDVRKQTLDPDTIITATLSG